MEKNGIFLFVMSPLVPEIFKIFVLMTSQGVTVWGSKHKVENISASNDAKQLEFGKHVVH